MITERLRRLVVGGLCQVVGAGARYSGTLPLAHCHASDSLRVNRQTLRKQLLSAPPDTAMAALHSLCTGCVCTFTNTQSNSTNKVASGTALRCGIVPGLHVVSDVNGCFHPSRTSTAPLGQTLICESGGQEVCCGIANPFESSHGYINRSICLATQMQRGVTNSAICL